MIQVTRPFVPNVDLLRKYLDQVHERAWFTNRGPLVQELTERLQDYLGVRNLVLTANGTLALQVAYKALGVHREAVTTPFSFIATASSMQWQGITPVFADIEPDSLCLCPNRAANMISDRTSAIVPVHVYGNPCNVEAFERLANRRKLPLIYDASHSFAVKYRGQSVLNWGDAATLSFHATKLFHTVEGGGIVFRDEEVSLRAQKMLNFGLEGASSDINTAGLNAKMSEVHAAYGLCALQSIDHILERRREVLATYWESLNGVAQFPVWRENGIHTGAYAPILLASEQQCITVLDELASRGIIARRYFYPALNAVSEFEYASSDGCITALDVASRALCLPIHPGLTSQEVQRVVEGVKEGCRQ